MSVNAGIAWTAGEAAPPRRNGELVFEAPWEARAFGVAVALTSRGLYDWDDFRAHLVEEIDARGGAAYYASWLGSLQRLLIERGLLVPEEIDERIAAFAHEDHHDHDHRH